MSISTAYLIKLRFCIERIGWLNSDSKKLLADIIEAAPKELEELDTLYQELRTKNKEVRSLQDTVASA